MEIVKELNLNGNPQVVPNGSLMYAKNIKLSDDGTYITNDDGFDTAFAEAEPSRDNLKVSSVVGTFCKSIKVTDSGDGEHLVGYINCPNEIVLFVYKKYGYIDPDTQQEVDVEVSEIYRAVELKYDEEVEVEGEEEPVSIHSDKLALYKVPTAWKYDNGKIIGTYTYNVYGHLIVAIAESDSYTIEIDSETGDEIHVPFDKQLMTIDLNDSSIEDPIDKYSCAPNIPICNLSLTSKIKGNPMPHGLYYFFVRYEIVDKVYTNWFSIGAPQYALSLDYKTIINHKYATDEAGTLADVKSTNALALVNTDKDSYYNFGFVIEFNETYNYKGYQIGYILQTEDTAVGRLWKSFSFNDGATKSFTFNGGFEEEVSLEDFSDNVLNVYNVKALTNYNSRLYIGNFKETKYNIIDDEIKECVSKIKAIQVKHKIDVDAQEESIIINRWTYTIDGQSASIDIPNYESSIPFTSFPDLITLMNNKADDTGLVRNFTGESYNLVFNENGIYVNPERVYGGKDAHYDDYYYYTGPKGGGFVCRFASYSVDSGEIGLETETVWDFRISKQITVTKTTSPTNYTSYNSDKTIRTLMPQEVYAFYVHYVRPDGSFTNGYPLSNTMEDDTRLVLNDYYKTLKDLKNEPDGQGKLELLKLDGIAEIKEMENKYVYEVASWDFNENDLTEYFLPYISESGRKLFKTGNGIITKNNVTSLLRIGVQFYGITYPKGYVGCFFSYEKVNSLSVYQAVVTDKFANGNDILCKSGDVEFANTRYDGTIFIPHHKIDISDNNSIKPVDFNTEVQYSYINNAAPVLSNAKISFLGRDIDRIGLHGGIAMNLSSDDSTIYQPSEYVIGNIIVFNKAIYSEDNKELIPFGPVTNKNYYGEKIDATDTSINYDMNYPSFVVQDNILLYKESIYINEKLSVNKISSGIIDLKEYYDDSDYAEIKSIWKFSNVNLLALTIKKEPEVAAGVINNDNNTINTIVKPVNASDLFKLESCYIPKVYKSYTNYNVKLVEANVFTNVIRATYPIRNESTVNSWRFLNPLSYYVIDNSNGEIVNMFGASSAFYIHTKNNLLVTTSNAKINADNTEININNNNIFDVDPKEIFTSDLGYGGLKYQECHLFSQFGYIWYDTERYKLFRYDNGRLIDINSGVDELLKKYKFEKCYINIDNENNRILFAFDEGNGDSITLGYDTLTGKWLSIYDFTFDRAIHTANYAMFNVGFEVLLYKYSKDDIHVEKCDYKSLARYNSDLPFYGTLQIGGYPLIKYCCFDIIFNPNYTIPKVLNSISWIHEYITRNTLDNNHPAELKIINRTITNKINDLDGLIIDIYSDSVDSGLLEVTPPSGSKLNDVADPTNPNAYKYPYYNKGVWNYSYFRNNIVTPVTDVELAALAQAYGVDVNTLKNVYKITDKNGNQLYIDGNPAYAASDLRSLIYGKYIAVRFIFKNTNKLKFDNLVINVQKY